MTQQTTSDEYARNIATQMRKGFLAYCVLKICREAMYTSDVIGKLRDAELVVVEGTIYPLLSKLQKTGFCSMSGAKVSLGLRVNTTKPPIMAKKY